jgi:lipid-binding SYLF domain-containing protein
MLNRRSLLAAGASIALTGLALGIASGPAQAAGRTVIDKRVRMALDQMFAQLPGTRDLAAQARGMLVMPSVVKGGFILGGAYGEGALLPSGGQGATASAYYSMASASVGLQLGVQSSSHVLFFMTDEALERFRRADGWEIGADAEVTLPESGMALQLNSTLMNKPVVGIVFGQDGFLLGASLEGAKYSPIVR